MQKPKKIQPVAATDILNDLMKEIGMDDKRGAFSGYELRDLQLKSLALSLENSRLEEMERQTDVLKAIHKEMKANNSIFLHLTGTAETLMHLLNKK